MALTFFPFKLSVWRESNFREMLKEEEKSKILKIFWNYTRIKKHTRTKLFSVCC